MSYESSGLANPEAKARLGEWQAVARDFVKQTGLRRDYAREHVGVERNLFNQRQAQPRGTDTKSENADNKSMKDENDYSESAKKMFPNEQWKEVSKNLFTASGRLPKNSDEKKKLEKEIAQAQILTANNHVVYLVPEPSDGGKKFDSFVDNRKTELKRVTGNIKAVGRNYREALQQGKDVFLSIQSADLHEVYKKVVSETKDHIKNAMKNNIEIDFSDRFIYVAIDSIEKLHKWSLKNIELQAKKMLQ